MKKRGRDESKVEILGLESNEEKGRKMGCGVGERRESAQEQNIK